MRLSDALEIGYLDVLEGMEDGREQRYVPHMRPTGSCGGCGAPVFPERGCDYCGTREGWVSY